MKLRDVPWWAWALAGAGGVALLAGGGDTSLFVIPIENHGFDQTIGNRSLPYLNQLARSGVIATNYTTRHHPSLPNYLLMTSGQTWGVRDDGYHLIDSRGADVFAQMTAHGVRWRAYAESMGTPCRTSDNNLYASRHNPAVYYASVVHGGACAQQVIDLSHMPGELAADAVRFGFIVPNLRNDWHDGTAAQLDAWLRTWIPTIMASPAYRRGGAIIIVADENDEGIRVPCIVISNRLHAPGTQDATPYDQRSLCATIQDVLGLPRLAATMGVASLAHNLG